MLVLFLISCSTDSNDRPEKSTSPRIRKQVSLVSPETNQSFRFGESITLQVTHRGGEIIDSVQFEFGRFQDSSPGDTYELNSRLVRVGNPKLKLTVFFKGKKETIFPKVRILAESAPQEYGFRIVNSFPHDPDAYTQGLFFRNDDLIESTGDETYKNSNSISTIRQVDYRTGKIQNQYQLEKPLFGEGCALWNDKIFQITYHADKAFVYNMDLQLEQTFNYTTSTGEGWGLTTMGDTLLMTDGSENVYFINPLDFSEIDKLQVYDDQGKVLHLNELEYFNGRLYSNIWTDEKDEIVIIDIKTGEVKGRIDFDGLIDRSQFRGFDYVLNGIAYHPEGRIFVTGKWWPNIYEVELILKSNT